MVRSGPTVVGGQDNGRPPIEAWIVANRVQHRRHLAVRRRHALLVLLAEEAVCMPHGVRRCDVQKVQTAASAARSPTSSGRSDCAGAMSAMSSLLWPSSPPVLSAAA